MVDPHSVTLQQQAANRALAAMVEEEDGVQMGNDLEESIFPPRHAPLSTAAAAAAAGGWGGHALGGMDVEKRRLAEEKKALELAQDKMSRDFHMQQHQAEKRLRELAFTIQLKQDLIRELVKTESSMQAAKEADDRRITALESEIEGLRSQQHDRRESAAGGEKRGQSRGGERDKDDDRSAEDHRLVAKLVVTLVVTLVVKLLVKLGSD